MEHESVISDLDIHFIETYLINKLHCSTKGGELNYLPGNKYGPIKIEKMLEGVKDKVVVYTFPIENDVIQEVSN